MNRLLKVITDSVQGLIKAVRRFPLAVICLISATVITCYMISLHTDPSLFIQKLFFTLGFGTFLSVAVQFCCERFSGLKKIRLFVYLIGALFIFGYYLIIAPSPGIYYAVTARTIVAVFAMFCIYIWVPSYRGKAGLNSIAEFNSIALTHFKAAVTSILFSAVLSAGTVSIIAAVDSLLFKVNEDSYAYTMAVIWISFATIYYLSRLPRFHSEEEEDKAFTLQAATYPKVLKILISYIVIPLIAAYSLVLIAYFVKMLVTSVWPSGQLGPMILAYSVVGLMVVVLASHLEDKFASAYRRIFPKVLILMVIMQLISAYIRLDAYGVTEGRYYLILFGIYSLICGIILSFRAVTKNYMIALLGAGLAIISVIPPGDAFTVSRNSQMNRLEQMLIADEVLVNGKIVPKADASLKLRQETTNILNYLERRNYLQYLTWLPEEMKTSGSRPSGNLTQEKMKAVFGFEPAYEGAGATSDHFYAALNMQKPLSVSGYDVMVALSNYRGMSMGKNGEEFERTVKIRNKDYIILAERLTPQEVRVSVQDPVGMEVIGTNVYEFATSLSGARNEPKEMLEPEVMSIHAENNRYKLKVIFQNINITFGTESDAGADYDLIVLFGVSGEQD
ncbi:hypothetical protein Sgly_1579 [Syntrophobotulus glycolicus DSM 8271]|uniref:DUF4153 domain-containing protein n=1 Tax=Syntrophobotulus glycolicus (strain DSM 8271 / FlGlyR) TaxID=645991 RepID=F0SXP4_SYNGF|nr:DUF4153 domain-containing protein [Syntrophobotulus glycolicus]ADY55877.1 hypothetical protein Sgly_1579 [Syntrophobotulus glycolicus DSM 8271]